MEFDVNSEKSDFVIKLSSNKDVELKKQKDKLFQRLKAASMKPSADSSKRCLNDYLKDADLLVGKRVKHKVQETYDEIPEWFGATVLKIDECCNHDTLKTKYDLYYNVDGKDILYTFPLLADLKKGNLIIVD